MSGSTSLPELPSGLLAALRAARRVVVLTGAGVSAESGVPTFREAQTGLWARFDPADLATPEAFQRDPDLVWRWYLWRRGLVKQASPNRGHDALVRLERLAPDLTLVTQNVDGLHQRAGSSHVVELHGSLVRTRCAACGRQADGAVSLEAGVPRCPCGGMLRPDVIWFGEALPWNELECALAAARGCDLFVSAGTSALVYPAASLPHEALAAGATVVEVNPKATPLTPRADYSLRGPSGEILPALVDAAWPQAVATPPEAAPWST